MVVLGNAAEVLGQVARVMYTQIMIAGRTGECDGRGGCSHLIGGNGSKELIRLTISWVGVLVISIQVSIH